MDYKDHKGDIQESLKRSKSVSKPFKAGALALLKKKDYPKLAELCYRYLLKNADFEAGRLLLYTLLELKQFKLARLLAESLLKTKGLHRTYAQKLDTVLDQLKKEKDAPVDPAYAYIQALLGQGGQATVSLCMIVKDEQDQLPKCLESAKPVVSQMVVVDTGSKDATKEIAACYGAKVVDFAWIDDFSAARNAGLQYATGDYILFLDADERLDKQSYAFFKNLKKNPLPRSYFARIENLTDKNHVQSSAVHYSTRMWTNHPAFRFRGKVHENITFLDSKIKPKRLSSDINILHTGYLESAMEKKSKLDRNLALLQAAIAEEPDNAFHEYNLGVQYMVMHESSKAVQHFALMEQKLKNSKPSYLLFGYSHWSSCLHKLKQYEQAEAMAQKALEDKPDFKDAMFNLATAQMGLKQFGEAKANYQRVLEEKEEGIMLGGTMDGGVRGWKTLNGLGVCCMNLEQEEEAVGHLEKAFSQQKNALSVLFNLLLAYKRTGRKQEAAHAVSGLKDCAYSDAQIRQIAQRLQKMGFGQMALAFLKGQQARQKKKLDPGQLDRLNEIADSYAGQKSEQGDKLFDQYYQEQESEAETLGKWALANLKAKKYEKAEKIFEKMLQGGTRHWSLYHNLGVTKMSLEKMDQARDLFEKAHRQNPQSLATCLQLAKCYLHQKQFDHAVGILEGAVDMDKDNVFPQMQMHLAQALFGQKKYSRALQHIQDFLGDKQDAAALNLAGLCYYRLKDYEPAAQYFSRATEADNRVPAYFVNLGNCLKKIENFGDAKLAYRCALMLDQGDPRARAGLESVTLREAFQTLS